MPETIYTLGHSNHSIEHLLNLLQGHGVTAVCDVRSKPYSGYNPQFDRETLKSALGSVGMAYVFLGRELGARSDDPSCYLYGKVQFHRLAETDVFQEGLKRIVEGMKSYRIALLCAEKEPLECHRTILIARKLVERGVDVQHIHANGKLESQGAAIARLVAMFKLPAVEQHLFATSDEVWADAYSLQEEKIWYDANAEVG